MGDNDARGLIRLVTNSQSKIFLVNIMFLAMDFFTRGLHTRIALARLLTLALARLSCSTRQQRLNGWMRDADSSSHPTV